jgi:hypothetical protein
VTELSEILKDFERRPPAPPATVAACENRMSLRLPSDYARFLEAGNGGQGFIGKVWDENWYLMLWEVEEIARFYEKPEVASEIPGFLAIGSDGGGELFGFDTRKTPWPIVMVPGLPMIWEYAMPAGNSFTDFLQRLYDGFDPFE